MDLSEKKEVLMHLVGEADDKLTGLLIAVASEYNDSVKCYTEEELAFFHNRKQAFLQSDKKGGSVTEVHARIRSNYSNGI